MLRYLKLEGFKNFQEALLPLGPFTVVVGTNASGKSNLRDAFRVLHGISRGYTIAETLGEKWVEGGVLQWRGIRGGTREAAFQGATSFALEVGFHLERVPADAFYRIEIDVGLGGKPPTVIAERLVVGAWDVFDTVSSGPSPGMPPPFPLIITIGESGKTRRLHNDRPVLTQLLDFESGMQEIARETIRALASMRFLDLSPDAMRVPSIPGQTILGDRGENLSSVLQAICQQESTRNALVEWVRALTPLDVVDFEFVPDQVGRVLVSLVEQGGQRVSAYSASDGTLRFLATIAALLGPTPANFYFFEELENGIHPTRIHLLAALIERKVSEGAIQVIASSHSPQLLGLLGQASLKHAALVYRSEGRSDARIRRILDIPEAARVLQEQDLARLHASGWLEDAVAFAESDDTPEQPEASP
ncbi:MAG TPA: AAA family ATPase [Archangium sp.]|jgi:predicted ATPase|uniref:AAA family ATPase n=1 Tax=Archangium sp. TaxID=1872627 RepID=UPI002EDAA3A2